MKKIFLHGVVGWDVDAKEFARELHDAADEPVEVEIHSPGGYVTDAAAIASAIRRHGAVSVTIPGLAASAASLIAMAAKHITMAPDAEMMIHRPWVIAAGESDSLRKTADHLDRTESRMIDNYVTKTGLDAEEIRDLLAAETWMSASEAVEWGFADEVGDEPGDLDIAATVQAYLDLAKTREDLGAYEDPRDRRMTIAATLKPNQPNLAQAADDQEEEIMDPELEENETAKDPVSETLDRKRRALVKQQEDIAKRNAEEKAIAEERTRQREIRALCAQHRMDDDICESMIDAGTSQADAQAYILDAIANRMMINAPGGGSVIVGESGRERLVEDVEAALEFRARLRDKVPSQNRFAHLPFLQMAAMFDPQRGMGSPEETLRRAWKAQASADAGITHTTSDFPTIFGNVLNKSLLKGYSEFPYTADRWTSEGSINNLQPAVKTGLGSFGLLAKVPEAGEYQSTTIDELSAQMQLEKFGKVFGITWEMMINDDVGAMVGIPLKMGQAARRSVETEAYTLLNDNVLVQDGTALFTVAHANGASDVLAGPALQAGIAAIKKQKTASGENAGLVPAYLVVPPDLEFTARDLVKQTTTGGEANILSGIVEVIVSPFLTSATAWFLVANPTFNDTAEIAYLRGQTQPQLFSEMAWRTDGTEYKVRHVYDAAILDYRGFYRGGVAIS